MENYKMYLELADSEVRAMESYSNFQMFLDETIESAMESSGSFKESLNKMKERIVKFFKMIFGAIQRFFIRLFGAGERLGHKKAIAKIRTYTMQIKNKVEVSIEALSKNISENDGVGLGVQIMYEGINHILELMEDEVHDLINSSKDRHEYSLISKNDLTYITEFTKKCESHIEHILELSSKHQSYSTHNNVLVSNLLTSISKIESTIMRLVDSAMWKGRVEDNETKLKNPITIEVED